MKTLLFSLLLFPIISIAQNIGADKYYFILEGDTIEGFHSDFKIENGKFEQYKAIEGSVKSRFSLEPPRTFTRWVLISTGEYRNLKPYGEWWEPVKSFRKKITFLENDSIKVSDLNYRMTMNIDSSYIKGFAIDARYNDLVWECKSKECKIWRKSGNDTLRLPFNQVLMQIDIGWAGYPRIK